MKQLIKKLSYSIVCGTDIAKYKTYFDCINYGAKASYSEINSILSDRIVENLCISADDFCINSRENTITIYKNINYILDYFSCGVLAHIFKKDNSIFKIYVLLEESNENK